MHQPLSENVKRLNHLTSEIEALYHEVAVKFALSDSAMQIFYTLYVKGGCCSLSDICKLCGTCKQTINSAIRKLEREEILYLTMQNGKNKLVSFTQKGRCTAQKTVARLIEAENQILDVWPKSEQEEYLRLTQKYLNDFKEKLPTL